MASEELDRVVRLREFLGEMTESLGRRERREALSEYLRGLMLCGERKSLEPIAQRVAPSADLVEAYRQRMQQAVTVAQWEDLSLYQRISSRFVSTVEDVEAIIFDDTGFAKKGKYSVGVQRQYSGTLGRVDNCQVAVSMHLGAPTAGACIGMRLFLPQTWDEDVGRRSRCQVPEEVTHKQKWSLALDMLDARKTWELQDYVILADGGYGDVWEFREGLEQREREYIVNVASTTAVFLPSHLPKSPEQRHAASGRRGITGWSRDVSPLSVQELANSLPLSAWHSYSWSNHSESVRTGWFAATRVHTAHRARAGAPPGQEQWLLIQWLDGDEEPSKYWLSNLPADTEAGRLVYLAKLRWRIERDYQEMKGELGLDHFEGRGWVGFHHHCALVATAHLFLALERALFPPEEPHVAPIPSSVAARLTSRNRPLSSVRQDLHI